MIQLGCRFSTDIWFYLKLVDICKQKRPRQIHFSWITVLVFLSKKSTACCQSLASASAYPFYNLCILTMSILVKKGKKSIIVGLETRGKKIKCKETWTLHSSWTLACLLFLDRDISILPHNKALPSRRQTRLGLTHASTAEQFHRDTPSLSWPDNSACYQFVFPCFQVWVCISYVFVLFLQVVP